MTERPDPAADFAARYHVSRETTDRLSALAALLAQWNRRINLVGRGTEQAVWSRHIADSAQLWALRPAAAKRWVDLGSGAGFPALVVAAMAAEQDPAVAVTLVESDQRKGAFLAAAARAMDVHVEIMCERIEAVPRLDAEVLSARALAPLDQLLDHLSKHRARDGIGLFHKGRTVHKEIAAASRKWRFAHRIHRSVTDPAAAILEVGALSRV